MDTSALVATLTSALAIGLTVVVLRLLRQDRQRSDARVAALVSLAGMPAVTAAPVMAFEHPPVRLDRRPIPARRSAPVPAPPRPARDADTATPARLSAADIEIFRDAAAASPAAAHVLPSDLFEQSAPQTGSHLLYIGLGAIVMAALIFMGFRWAVGSSPAATTETSAALAPAAAATAQPLGLVSLQHEQSGDGTLVISGVVRNPADSITRERIFAAASLVDAAGTLVATARAPLDFTSLAPGEESPFVVRIAAADGVARYRIGFRDAAGAAVAHIDRR